MADVTIVDSEVANTPTDYQVPAAQEIILKSITAHFNGSGAGSLFVPTLQIIAPDGVTTWSYPASKSVAAGASADVAWFPGGGLIQAGTPSTTFHGVRALCLGPDLTGTLTKTMGSPIVTGVGTKFLTELRPGQLYGVRFYLTNNETLIVNTIQSDTQFTATSNAVATQAGDTGTVDQIIPNATYTAALYQGVDFFDTDDYHFTSNATLSGTVTKTMGSSTIAGAGSSFLTEVAVNQAIKIPGGGSTDVVLVKSIESNTSLTVWSNNLPANTAAGQTATLDPSVIGIPAGLDGCYLIIAQVDFRNSQDGTERHDAIFINIAPSHALGIRSADSQFYAPTAVNGEMVWTTTMAALLNAGDIIRDWVYQASGGLFGLTPTYGLTAVRMGI